MNNIGEIDRNDYKKYQQKREFFGYKQHTYSIIHINFDKRTYVEEKKIYISE
jgi:hypothetical protein